MLVVVIAAKDPVFAVANTTENSIVPARTSTTPRGAGKASSTAKSALSIGKAATTATATPFRLFPYTTGSTILGSFQRQPQKSTRAKSSTKAGTVFATTAAAVIFDPMNRVTREMIRAACDTKKMLLTHEALTALTREQKQQQQSSALKLGLLSSHCWVETLC